MKPITGVQQIMLGQVTRTEQEALETLGRIREAGYDGIELNRFMIHPSSLLVRLMTKAAGMPVGKSGKLDWHRLVQEVGLKVLSLHTDLNSVLQDPKTAAEEAKSFGTNKLVITGMYRFNYADEQAIDGLCRNLNDVASRLATYDVQLLYHNHNIEFVRLPSGQTAYEYILDHSRVNLEFDSFWAAEAGVDVVSMMERLGSRMQLWHINDRGYRASGKPAMTPIVTSDSMELGCGNLPLSQMAKIACRNGVEAIILESHRNWVDGDPLKSIEKSSAFLKGLDK